MAYRNKKGAIKLPMLTICMYLKVSKLSKNRMLVKKILYKFHIFVHQIGRVHLKCNKCMLVQHCGKQKKMLKRTLKTLFKTLRFKGWKILTKLKKIIRNKREFFFT